LGHPAKLAILLARDIDRKRLERRPRSTVDQLQQELDLWIEALTVDLDGLTHDSFGESGRGGQHPAPEDPLEPLCHGRHAAS
jgi:hypothetical protein